MLNFIKQRPVHSKMFKSLSKHPDKEHKSPATHRYLVAGKGRLLNRGLELKGELQDPFQENRRPEFAGCFEDEEWLQKLAFLADIFDPTRKVN